MLVIYCNKYHSLKPKDLEEFILNPRLMKDVKFWERKKFFITEKKDPLCKVKSGFITELY